MDNPITIEEDEGFSEPRTPVKEPPRQPPMLEASCASLRTCKILRTQQLDSSLIEKQIVRCLVFCNLIFLHLVVLF